MDNETTTTLGQWRVAGALVAMLAVVGGIDWWTGHELSFSLFYLGPVSFLAWRGGRTAGIVAAVASTLVWRLADHLAGATYSHPLIPWWNAGIRFGFFLGFAVLLDRLRRQLDTERRLARRDALTGLANSRWFEEEAREELERSARYGHPLAVAYVDLDDFKQLNDRLGHGAGDEALSLVGRLITRELRRTDRAARLGGDEFAILMPESGAAEAEHVLGRLQSALLHEAAERDWPIGMSIGAVAFARPPATVDELLRVADRLMYAVKEVQKGGLRVEAVEEGDRVHEGLGPTLSSPPTHPQ